MNLIRGLSSELEVSSLDESGRSATRFVVQFESESFVVSALVAHVAVALRGRDRTLDDLRAELSEETSEVELRAVLDAIPPSWRDPNIAKPRSPFVISRELVPPRVAEAIARRLTFCFSPQFVCIASISLGICAWEITTASHRHSDGSAVGVLVAYFGILIHEFGHAAALCRFGRRPGGIGIGVYLFFPVLYSKVNGAWMLTRRQRVIVDIAGIWFQLLFLVVLFAVDAFVFRIPGIRVTTTITLATIAVNLNPLIKLDGYWILGDAIGVANLHDACRTLYRARFRFNETPLAGLGYRLRAVLTIYTFGVVSYLGFLIFLLARWSLQVGPALLNQLPKESDNLAKITRHAGIFAALASFSQDVWRNKQTCIIVLILGIAIYRFISRKFSRKGGDAHR